MLRKINLYQNISFELEDTPFLTSIIYIKCSCRATRMSQANGPICHLKHCEIKIYLVRHLKKEKLKTRNH